MLLPCLHPPHGQQSHLVGASFFLGNKWMCRAFALRRLRGCFPALAGSGSAAIGQKAICCRLPRPLGPIWLLQKPKWPSTGQSNPIHLTLQPIHSIPVRSQSSSRHQIREYPPLISKSNKRLVFGMLRIWKKGAAAKAFGCLRNQGRVRGQRLTKSVKEGAPTPSHPHTFCWQLIQCLKIEKIFFFPSLGGHSKFISETLPIGTVPLFNQPAAKVPIKSESRGRRVADRSIPRLRLS